MAHVGVDGWQSCGTINVVVLNNMRNRRRFSGRLRGGIRPTGKQCGPGANSWSSPCIGSRGQRAIGFILAELNFEQLDEAARRRLFVGMTRARLALEVVVSRAAEAALR